MPFTHNIDPVLVHLGPLEIRYYGLVYVIAFVLVYFYFRYLVKHRKVKLSEDELYDFILYNMVGVLVGSRLIHCIFWDPIYYLSQPWKILFVWEGGMAFHGGLLGVAVATYLFWRKIGRRISFAKLGDYLSMPALFMLAVGRIANFVNGELPGRVTDVSWCVYFPGYEGCRHPQQLYSALKRFIVFGWLVFLNTRKHKDGFIIWNMVFFVGIGRFFIDFYREDPTLLGLAAGQYLSIIMIVAGAYALARYYRDDIRRLFSLK
ncbi:prolipoprotein diacylglyceryl transferase [Candidatus Woesearchaeota archaeon]|nr:prolipoprotein diacylglyceryl transferase [Candidatus Woesearchaeota archaeon]